MAESPKAIGIVETISIAAGIEALDSAYKAANVKILFSQPICAGKFVFVVFGDVAEVKAAIESAEETAKNYTIATTIIPRIHPQVETALYGNNSEIKAIGVVETMNIVSAFLAADSAAKAANITILDLRIARGLGGRSFFVVTGDVADCKAAVEAAKSTTQDILKTVVIPRPAKPLLSRNW